MAKAAIPVTVIGGYLGSGKTTLLNGLLRGDHGRRLAVLINDFGSINIDAGLITAHGGDTIGLANGCICCALKDDLGSTLHHLTMRSDPPDQIVIEASGVADPGRIGHYARSLAGLQLDAVIVTVDAEQVRRQADDKYVGDVVRQQMAAADLLVATKTDLIAPETAHALRQWLAAHAPGVGIVEVVAGHAPPAAILGTHRHGTVPEPLDHGHSDEPHDHRFAQVTYTAAHPLDRAALVAAIAALPAGIVRAKGILDLADTPDHQVILQVVGRRQEWQTGDPWGHAPRESRLVLIGPRALVDAEAVGPRLLACVTDRRPFKKS